MLALLCAGVVLSMSCWFSATAIIPDLIRDWSLTAAKAGWLTNGVQIGFVLGALLSSLFNLPDIIPLTRLVALSAILAGLSNAVLLLEPAFGVALFARFVTGAALAGVYPPAMKLLATWFVRGRGLAMGLLIGSLTLGSSLPHLFRAISAGFDWRGVVIASSLAPLVAAAVFGLALHEGPHSFGRATFDPRRALDMFRNRPLFLANLGYFGHMWELYAMWAWFLALATEAENSGVPLIGSASMLAFLVVGVGAVGSIAGGLLSDRIGRCLTTAGMLAVSGSCAILIGFAFDGPVWFFSLVALIWGVSIVGDSAQFSTAATELADPRFVGTVLTVQVSIGFALTVLTIWAMPYIAEALGGWRWAFLVLVPGPIVGVWAMLRLRSMPESLRLAGGRR